MKLEDSDLEESYFPSNHKTADNSAGYILAGLIVVLLFSLYLFGLQRVQSVSDQVVGNHARPTSEPPPDISEDANR